MFRPPKLQLMLVTDDFEAITEGCTEAEKAELLDYFSQLAQLSHAEIVQIGLEEYRKVMSRDGDCSIVHLN